MQTESREESLSNLSGVSAMDISGEKVEDILEKYKELSTAHFHLRRRKRK